MSNRLSRLQTNLHQYGIWPPRALSTAATGPYHTILANSIPKAGTNLLIRTLCLIGQYHRKIHRTFVERTESDLRSDLRKPNKNKILVGHMPFNAQLAEDLKRERVANILMVRDPRDIALSNVHYIARIDKSHRLHQYFSKNLSSFEERLSASINGISSKELGNAMPPSYDIGWHIRRYLAWAEDKDCLVVRFEDLIGERGGGCRRRQQETLHHILRHLDLESAKLDTELIANRIFHTGSRTFNVGTIGQWKAAFQPQHTEAIERVAGDCISRLGYR